MDENKEANKGDVDKNDVVNGNEVDQNKLPPLDTLISDAYGSNSDISIFIKNVRQTFYAMSSEKAEIAKEHKIVVADLKLTIATAQSEITLLKGDVTRYEKEIKEFNKKK